MNEDLILKQKINEEILRLRTTIRTENEVISVRTEANEIAPIPSRNSNPSEFHASQNRGKPEQSKLSKTIKSMKGKVLSAFQKQFSEKRLRFKDPLPKHWWLKRMWKSLSRRQSPINKLTIFALNDQVKINETQCKINEITEKTFNKHKKELKFLAAKIDHLDSQIDNFEKQSRHLESRQERAQLEISTIKGVSWAMSSRLEAQALAIDSIASSNQLLLGMVEKLKETTQIVNELKIQLEDDSTPSQSKAMAFASSAMLETIKCLTSPTISFPHVSIPKSNLDGELRNQEKSPGSRHFPITVIVPTQGRRSTLIQTVKSIFDSPFGGQDLLVLDGSGTGSVEAMLGDIQDRPIRILKVDPETSMSEKIKRGLMEPLNSWVTILGDDDVLKPSFFEIAASLVTLHPEATLYQTGIEIIDNNGNTIDVVTKIPETQSASEYLLSRIKWKQPSYLAGYFYRADDARSVGGFRDFDMGFYADDCFYLELAEKRYKAFSPQVGAAHRSIVDGGSASGAENPRASENTAALLKYWCVLMVYAQKNHELAKAINEYVCGHFEVGNLHYLQSVNQVTFENAQPDIGTIIRAMAISHLSNSRFGSYLEANQEDANEIRHRELKLLEALLDSNTQSRALGCKSSKRTTNN